MRVVKVSGQQFIDENLKSRPTDIVNLLQSVCDRDAQNAEQKQDLGTAVALGFFDGVHIGHQRIISAAVSYAAENKLMPVVLTMDKHPRALTAANAPLLITDIEAKLQLFAKLGVKLVVLLEFNDDLMKLSADEYLNRYLESMLHAKYIGIGFDHHFGHKRSGSPELLRNWASWKNIAVDISERIALGELTASSSTIRSLLRSGDISAVNKLLARNHMLSGIVVHGEARGRELGFPTANIKVNPQLILPANGVYVVSAFDSGNSSAAIGDSMTNQGFSLGKGLVNIGSRPTFSELGEITVELYLPDKELDLYGHKLCLAFEARLRDEVKFEGAEQLIRQIELDLQGLRQYLH